MNDHMPSDKQTIHHEGLTYNLHLFGRTAPAGHQGCFELYDDKDDGGIYAEGGLWIRGRRLVDYDGIFALPAPVVGWLRSHGIVVPPEAQQ